MTSQNALRRGTSWTRIAILVALASITTLSPLQLDAQRTELEKFIRHKVLANGLEVIVAESHGVPLATIEFNVRNGSYTQRPGTEGLAHMYEHMFFKANKDLPEPDQFTDRAAELGAVFNGSTREEVVNYYLTLPSPDGPAVTGAPLGIAVDRSGLHLELLLRRRSRKVKRSLQWMCAVNETKCRVSC
jgi:zinc protease